MKQDAYKPRIVFLACFLLLAVAFFNPLKAFGAPLSAGQVDTRSLTSGQPSTQVDMTPIYRLYNYQTGEHLYTTDKHERNTIVGWGWFYEGVGWMAPKSGQDVYRVYDTHAEEHHYTTDRHERDVLVSKGWRYEGVSFKAASGNAAGSRAIYRQFNPNASSGFHNFTTDAHERSVLCGSWGWNDEGIAWYGFDKPSTFKDDMEPWKANISGDTTLDRHLYFITRTHKTLRSCYDYVADFAYISGDKFWSGPRVLSNATTIQYAKEMMRNKGGNCYRYASLFMWLARALGYDANTISGYVPSIYGGSAPHGWVEIKEKGTTYICDPDMYNAIRDRNWYMVTYANAPLTYGNW